MIPHIHRGELCNYRWVSCYKWVSSYKCIARGVHDVKCECVKCVELSKVRLFGLSFILWTLWVLLLLGFCSCTIFITIIKFMFLFSHKVKKKFLSLFTTLTNRLMQNNCEVCFLAIVILIG
jgi:hypothetical protein